MFFWNDHFNQDIESWDVSSATDMSGILFRASAFNRDLRRWIVLAVAGTDNMFGEDFFQNRDLVPITWHNPGDKHVLFRRSRR
jgi:surface protein